MKKGLTWLFLSFLAINCIAQQPFEHLFADDFIKVAHRGGSKLAPENTLASIRKALSLHVDFIEIDVHQSKDGVVLVMHDKTLERTTNGEGVIKDLNWSEFAQLDAGSHFSPEFADEKVPSLKQVIELINGQTGLLIEVKKGSRYYTGIEDTILQIIRDHQAEDWCEILSFNDAVLRKFDRIAPDIHLNKLIVHQSSWLPGYLDTKPHLGGLKKYDFVDRIGVYQKWVKPHVIRKIHKMNKQVLIWTVNNREDMLKFLEWGADGIITDRPDWIAKPRN